MAYTTIDDPSAHFQTLLYTGNATGRSLTNTGNSDLQPDLVWVKDRSTTNDHKITDSSRLGGGSGPTRTLESNTNAAEYDDQGEGSDATTSFDTDGFTIGTNGNYNTNTNTYVAWQWKANGGTTSSNTSGNITTTVQANTTAGFSIVTWEGANSTATLGHGLGVVPTVVLIKALSYAEAWTMYHHSIGIDDTLRLNSNAAKATTDNFYDTVPTSTVIYVGNQGEVNEATRTYVAYCWNEIQGFSKFGKYEGNGNADGAFVYTGFRPAWVMTKSIDSTSEWHIFDDQREGFNRNTGTNAAGTGNDALTPEGAAELTTDLIDIVSNGFKCRTSGDPNVAETYVYAAFAKAPFVNSNGVPCNGR